MIATPKTNEWADKDTTPFLLVGFNDGLMIDCEVVSPQSQTNRSVILMIPDEQVTAMLKLMMARAKQIRNKPLPPRA